MISKIRLTLQAEKQEDLSWHSASLLHGVLMERLPPAYAERLHIALRRPFAQHLKKKDGCVIWEVNTLDCESYQNIAMLLLDGNFREFTLKHKNAIVAITKKELVTSLPYGEFVKAYYLAPQLPRFIKLAFNTPAAFKQNGRYTFFPQMRLILKSAMQKYDAATSAYKVYSEEALDELAECCVIRAYRLKSVNFNLESVRIPAFIGEILIEVNANNTIKSLAHLLLNYAAFSGIGIKSALGMGAVEIPPKAPAQVGASPPRGVNSDV